MAAQIYRRSFSEDEERAGTAALSAADAGGAAAGAAAPPARVCIDARHVTALFTRLGKSVELGRRCFELAVCVVHGDEDDDADGAEDAAARTAAGLHDGDDARARLSPSRRTQLDLPEFVRAAAEVPLLVETVMRQPRSRVLRYGGGAVLFGVGGGRGDGAGGEPAPSLAATPEALADGSSS